MLIGWTTVSKREDAGKLAEEAVGNGLVACAQIDGPLVSVYRWKGEIQKDEEFRLTLKFMESKLESVEKWILERHPYENPQWIVVKSDQVSEKYLNWAREESR